jgi:hypothetical protein
MPTRNTCYFTNSPHESTAWWKDLDSPEGCIVPNEEAQTEEGCYRLVVKVAWSSQMQQFGNRGG